MINKKFLREEQGRQKRATAMTAVPASATIAHYSIVLCKEEVTG